MKRGIALTTWLNQAIPENIDIEISYLRLYEDPNRKHQLKTGKLFLEIEKMVNKVLNPTIAHR